MKSFNQFITERPVKFTSYLPGYETMMKTERGLENPSVAELTSFIKNTKFREVRILVNSKGSLTVWNAEKSIHQEIMNGEGLELEDVVLGIIRLENDGSWLIGLQKYGGRNKYGLKNKVLAKLMKDKDNKVQSY